MCITLFPAVFWNIAGREEFIVEMFFRCIDKLEKAGCFKLPSLRAKPVLSKWTWSKHSFCNKSSKDEMWTVCLQNADQITVFALMAFLSHLSGTRLLSDSFNADFHCQFDAVTAFGFELIVTGGNVRVSSWVILHYGAGHMQLLFCIFSHDCL